MTPKPPTENDDRSRVRLNVTLYVAAVLALGVAILSGLLIWNEMDESPETGSSSRAGDRLGEARIEALPLAEEDEQERNAAVIESASKMANAFLNVRHDDIDAYVESVRALASGSFQKQFDKSTEGITKLTQRAKSIQTGEVLWSGIVASDDDSATVIVASTGTVSNNTTEFKAVARQYRLQLDLTFEDDKWLTSDLQFVP